MSKLHVVATPIGNLGDLSPRALEALRSSALIACEDTRRTWALLTHFGIPRPEMVSYRQGNEERLTERIIAAVDSGTEVSLCSCNDQKLADRVYQKSQNRNTNVKLNVLHLHKLGIG